MSALAAGAAAGGAAAGGAAAGGAATGGAATGAVAGGSGTLAPRVVVVTRRTELAELLARHGTRGAAAYFLRQRGRDLDEVTARHEAQQRAVTEVTAGLPADWRRGSVERADLPRFLFAPEDIVIAIGQDGLVANVAKYLNGQPVIGVNPEKNRNPGILVRHEAADVPKLLTDAGRAENRTMVMAKIDDGQELYGLNEIYVGHPSHQSARYVLATPDGRHERQSSSGLIAGTGTGATGWCASIARERATAPPFPAPGEPAICWFVREAWPSPATGVNCDAGLLDNGAELELTSESERLVVFADGLESDAIELSWGQRLRIGVAPRHLRLI